MSAFYELSVKEIIRETEKSVSILFDIPLALKPKFTFVPGQYITIKKELDGQEVRRAYSICSSEKSDLIRIAVKSVDKGTFSVFATNSLKEGDLLEVSPPEGRFVLRTAATHKKNYLAFAAGSGITPVLSMLKSVLETEPQSIFVLVYGNKLPKEVMFKSEIDTLQEKFPSQFFVHYVYSQANEEAALFGRIENAVVNYILKNKHAELDFDEFFLCGPEPMIQEVTNSLVAKGVSNEAIHFELFSTAVDELTDTENFEGMTDVHVVLDDEELTFSMERSSTILEAALDDGIDAPYSCQGGVCSSCLAQIVEGKAIMDKNSILTDAEVADGLILTCQAHPTTNKITIDYDAV